MSHVDDVIDGLERVRKSLCAYEGPTCDCKGGFGVDVRPGTEATGCVELRRAGALLRGVAKALDGALVLYPAEKAEVDAFVERTFAPTSAGNVQPMLDPYKAAQSGRGSHERS